LDLQSASVDKIHGDISTLTDLVTQLAISLGKRPDAGGTQSASAPPATSTPPPHQYKPALSPIPEVSTPLSSSPAAAALPIHFGNLSPRHLPHPDFPVQQGLPKPPPLVGPSSTPPASTQAKLPPSTGPSSSCPPAPPHITQLTNPTSQPHYYTPSPTYSPPQFHPNFNQPIPYQPTYVQTFQHHIPFASISPNSTPYYPPISYYPPHQPTYTSPQPTLPITPPNSVYPPTYNTQPHNPAPPSTQQNVAIDNRPQHHHVEPNIRSPTLILRRQRLSMVAGL
jgi:hypothetical protein